MSPIAKLIFTPEDFRQTVAGNCLIEGLTQLGWLGADFVEGPAQSFFVGEGFFKYITFMGCAPALRLEPATPTDRNFCFIRLNTALDAPVFRGHQERFVPRCRSCRHGLPDWRAQLLRWQSDPQARFACPHCAAELTLPTLHWREKAAIGRCFIEVYSVYPHEGIPTPAFLTELRRITDVDWNYFFEPG
ncbi:MAG: phage terminase large subunit family protein [Gammaproteobacteria bacterium]